MSQFFAFRAATDNRLLKRSCESLLGIATGMLVDNKLDDNEILFLDTWLKEHGDIANTWPGDVIHRRVQQILTDGVITDTERESLKTTLAELIGGTFTETGAVEGGPTSLPIEQVDQIEFKDRRFCFTGTFLYGTRKACEKAVEDRGGEACKNVIMGLDYLVIGTLVTRDWANTSHGRKIEKAMNYKSREFPITIISEEQWVAFLG